MAPNAVGNSVQTPFDNLSTVCNDVLAVELHVTMVIHQARHNRHRRAVRRPCRHPPGTDPTVSAPAQPDNGTIVSISMSTSSMHCRGCIRHLPAVRRSTEHDDVAVLGHDCRCSPPRHVQRRTVDDLVRHRIDHLHCATSRAVSTITHPSAAAPVVTVIVVAAAAAPSTTAGQINNHT